MAALWHHLPAVAAGVSADRVDSHVPKAAATNNASAYASPLELTLSPDQKRLYVVCQQAGQVRELDAVSGRTLRAVAVGREPRGFTFSPHADRLFVVNSWDDTVSVIDIRSFKVIANWPVAAEPSSVMFDTGNNGAGRLFVANRISNDVAVLNASTGAEEARLTAGRGASYMAASSNSGKLFVTHIYPNPGPHRTAPESEVTIIDPSEARVVDRMQLHSIAGLASLPICIRRTLSPWHTLSTDGRLAIRSLSLERMSAAPSRFLSTSSTATSPCPSGSQSHRTSPASTLPMAALTAFPLSMFRACCASFTHIQRLSRRTFPRRRIMLWLASQSDAIRVEWR
jgi:YVTN family beta-propeller protein